MRTPASRWSAFDAVYGLARPEISTLREGSQALMVRVGFLSLRDLGLLVSLGALWGASFLFIQVSASALGPFVLVELRVGLAALALAVYALALGKSLKIRARWREFLLLGALNAAIPFTLISAAQLKLTASFGAILNSTAPLFGAVVAAIWIGDALTGRKVVGLLMGVVGVAILVGWNPLDVDLALVFAICAALTASLFYGIGSVYAKRNFTGIPPLGLAVGQLSGAAAVTMPIALADFPREVPPAPVAVSVLALALMSTAVAYLIYFRLISSVGPTKTLTVTFLVPIFGVALGALVLNEPVGGGLFVGMAIILVSLVFVNEVRFRKRTKAT